MDSATICRQELRVLLLYEYRLGHSATEACANLCNAIDKDVISYETTRVWFARFKKGVYDMEDQPRSGRPVALNVDELTRLVEEDPRQSTRTLAALLSSTHTTINRHLKQMGKSWKWGAWVPHALTDSQRQVRTNICLSLLTPRRTFNWLEYLVTGDEKWVLYVNHTRKRQWLTSEEEGIPTPKAELHPKKIMLCIWWSVHGIIHWELLPKNTTITANLYCQQLEIVAQKLVGKQDKVFFLHDNARPHTSMITQQKLMDLGWTVIPHPPYSPDIAPTDYHLFRSLAHHLEDKYFDDEEHLKSDLDQFFTAQPLSFYKDGIMALPKKWRDIVEHHGDYVY